MEGRGRVQGGKWAIKGEEGGRRCPPSSEPNTAKNGKGGQQRSKKVAITAKRAFGPK